MTLTYFSRSRRRIFDPHQELQVNSTCQAFRFLWLSQSDCQKTGPQTLKPIGQSFYFLSLNDFTDMTQTIVHDTRQRGRRRMCGGSSACAPCCLRSSRRGELVLCGFEHRCCFQIPVPSRERAQHRQSHLFQKARPLRDGASLSHVITPGLRGPSSAATQEQASPRHPVRERV